MKGHRVFALFALILASICYFSYSHQPHVAADFSEISAVHSGNRLELIIPFQPSAPNLTGALRIEILDAEDRVIARQLVSQPAARGWKTELLLPTELKRADLVWHRLRYRFTPQGRVQPTQEAIHSINQIMRYPVVRLLGQKEFISGSANALRVVALDARTGMPIDRGNLTIELKVPEHKPISARATLDSHGTAEPQLEAPADFTGEAEMKINVSTPLGDQQLIERVAVVRRENILLTTDKPIYQPGHLIHIRSLALDRATRKAAAARPLTFEIEDAKGNKVFKKRLTTDQFGVASAQFQLAEEVNTGTFKLRAILGEADSARANIQEKSFVVDRYVLPKFKIEVKMEGSSKKYFAPGEMVAGKITAKYLFGKPLARARVQIKMSTFDVEHVELGKDESITNENGEYNFALRLPNALAGSRLEQGAAPVALEVEVTDSANHSESRAERLLVSNNPILITAIPESGEIVPRLANKIYLLTSYPDGTPARTTISGNFTTVETDNDGIATVEITPTNSYISFNASAQDATGKKVAREITLYTNKEREESLILRTDRAVYKVGDQVDIAAVSTKPRGSMYIDVIKDRRTVLTRALDIAEGRTHMALDLTPDLFGTVEIRAYLFGRDADPISDRRLIFVDPADELKIATRLSKESFRPGEEAEIQLNVTDNQGRPKVTVLDLQAVDEAVFALSERQPGFEKVFFYLEQELLKPRYEIHSVDSGDLLPVDDEQREQAARTRERAAQVLLAAASEVNVYDLRANLDGQIEAKKDDYAAKYYQLTFGRLQRALTGLNRFLMDKGEANVDISVDLERALNAGYINAADTVDPWGQPLRFEGQNSSPDYYYSYATFTLPSAEDQKFFLPLYGNKVARAVEPRVVHDFPGTVRIVDEAIGSGQMAAISVQVNRQVRKNNVLIKGEPSLANAIVKVVSKRDGKTYSGHTNGNGTVTFERLKPGAYEIVVEAAGYYRTGAKSFDIEARDRALINVTLQADKSQVMQLNLYPDQGFNNGRANGRAINGRNMVEFEAQLAQAPALDMPRRMAVNKAQPGMVAAAKTKASEASAANEKKRDASADKDLAPADDAQGEGARVRSYFPETLYVNPSLVTDAQGNAVVRIPLADSITTWRLSMMASTKQGALGSATTGIRVFQDFFIDIDLPVSLTQSDAVSIPVAVYNYLPSSEQIELTLKQEDWFELDSDQPVKQIALNSEEVGVVNYRIRASQIGTKTLTVSARLLGRNSSANGDAIARQIEVLPNGEMQNITINDRIEGRASKQIVIPQNAIADASKIMVKFYPGPLSQVVEGLDSILRMPGGCFEQTSSSTYPNILVMDYMKTTKRITPEIQAKAEGFISLGYQKLVTFEVQGGGFSWFGQAPANKILTAYGLMEFFDMSAVHEVDPRLIERTQNWLASQQQQDGSWAPDQYFIDEGATNNFHNDRVRITAYIAWALVYSGYKGPAADLAKQYLERNVKGTEDAYTLTILANFATDYKKDQTWTDRTMGSLITKVTETEKMANWSAKGLTPTYARGDMADIETTALAAQALIKWGRNSNLATKALNFLTDKKDAFGNWQSTQATILSLKAFLLSQKSSSAGDTEGTITVALNGKTVKELAINKENNDLMHLIDLKEHTVVGANRLDINFTGKGSLLYQAVGRYYRPWGEIKSAAEPLSINIAYDRTRLATDDIATATVTVRNNLPANANMVMIDLGIAPGFAVMAEDFQQLIGAKGQGKLGHITKVTFTAKQVIVYLDGLQARQALTIKYRLRAKYPVKAKTFASRVYEYYNPQVGSTARPVDLAIVDKKK